MTSRPLVTEGNDDDADLSFKNEDRGQKTHRASKNPPHKKLKTANLTNLRNIHKHRSGPVNKSHLNFQQDDD